MWRKSDMKRFKNVVFAYKKRQRDMPEFRLQVFRWKEKWYDLFKTFGKWKLAERASITKEKCTDTSRQNLQLSWPVAWNTSLCCQRRNSQNSRHGSIQAPVELSLATVLEAMASLRSGSVGGNKNKSMALINCIKLFAYIYFKQKAQLTFKYSGGGEK